MLLVVLVVVDVGNNWDCSDVFLEDTNLSSMRWFRYDSSCGGRVSFFDLLVMCCSMVACCGEGSGSCRNCLAFCRARIGAKWWPTGFVRLCLCGVVPVGSIDR